MSEIGANLFSSDFLATDTASVRHVLGLGLSAANRPIDELINQLKKSESVAWLENTLDAAIKSGAGPGQARSMLLAGRATLQELQAIKDQSKHLLKPAASPSMRIQALAGYFFVLAAALAHHREVISQRPPAEIRSALIDLATAAPEPWNEMLGRAVIVLEERIHRAEPST